MFGNIDSFSRSFYCHSDLISYSNCVVNELKKDSENRYEKEMIFNTIAKALKNGFIPKTNLVTSTLIKKLTKLVETIESADYPRSVKKTLKLIDELKDFKVEKNFSRCIMTDNNSFISFKKDLRNFRNHLQNILYPDA